MAALAAARTGARVVLCDEDFRARRAAARRIAGRWASAARRSGPRSIAAELAALPDVRILPRTTVFGVYDDGTYRRVERVNDHLAEPPAHEPRQRLWRIVAKRCVLAAGAIERPLVFGDNDRPGVMLAGAVRTYLNRYAAAPGRSAVVFATSDETARTVARPRRGPACAWRRSSIARTEVPASIEAAAKAPGARLLAGGAVARAHRLARACARSTSERPTGETERIACDLVAMSGGWSPTLHLTSPSRQQAASGTTRIAAFVPGALPARAWRSAGAAGGRLGLPEALDDRRPRRAWRPPATAASAGQPVDVPEVEPESTALAPLWRVRGMRRQGLRRLPERRDRRRRRARRARGLPLGRAPEALHDARHGDRPGQDLQRHRPRADGGADAPSRSRRPAPPPSARPSRRSPSARSPGTIAARSSARRGCRRRTGWAQEQGAVFVETGPWLRAQWYPQARRERLAREREPRGADRALGRRRVRRLDARQDRRAGAGRRRVPRPPLHQHLDRRSPSAGRATA